MEPRLGRRDAGAGRQADPGDEPDFGDFETCEAARIVDNRSSLFKNTPQAWHGVSALTCPAGSYRRLFNIIFEVPANRGFIDHVRELLNAGRARGSEARGGA